MKKFNFLIIFLLFLVQFSFLPIFFENLEVPNLILIGAIIAGFGKSFWETLGWLILAGMIFEFFGSAFFGFYLLIFILVGLVVWALRNVILNQEFDFLIETLFWVFVKVSWDLIFQLENWLLKIFQKNDSVGDFSVFPSWIYLENLILFVVAGLFLGFVVKKLLNEKGTLA